MRIDDELKEKGWKKMGYKKRGRGIKGCLVCEYICHLFWHQQQEKDSRIA